MRDIDRSQQKFIFLPQGYDSNYFFDGTILLRTLDDLVHELIEFDLFFIIEQVSGLSYFKSWPYPHLLTKWGSEPYP